MDLPPPSQPPTTPNRTRNAYPSDLSRADAPRIPLHRRGTSGQFERFEDLLREAGFKETRVFTPENERREAANADARIKLKQQLNGSNEAEQDRRKGTGGIVSFLAGFVPSWADNDGSRRHHIKTQSLGRATGKQQHIVLNDDDEDDGDENSGEDQTNPATPTPYRQKKPPIITTSDFSSPGSSSSSTSRSPPLFQKKLKPLTQQRQEATVTPHGSSARPRPDARSSLRHMISAPDFAHQRPGLQKGRTRRATAAPKQGGQIQRTNSQSSDKSLTIKTGGNSQHPPLPNNWLNTVTNAVMGAAGAHVGGPRGRPRVQTSLQTHRRSQTVVTGDSTNGSTQTRSGSLVRHGFAPRTPIVETIPGLVTPASVVCRSAPGSRSTSLARQATRSGGTRRGANAHRHEPGACVPCLGVTCIELSRISTDAELEAFEHCTCDDHHLPSQRNQDYAETPIIPSVYEDSDLESDGELDFARLIVPARRQHSIHSLRRHLHNHNVAVGGASSTRSPPSAYTNTSRRPPDRSNSRTSLQTSLRGATLRVVTGDKNANGGRREATRSGNSVSASGLGPPPVSAVSDGILDPDADPELDGMLPRARSGMSRSSTSVRLRVSGRDEDDEDEDELRRWAERGLPGLGGAVSKKRGALPWNR
jgi:hypothetical protein